MKKQTSRSANEITMLELDGAEAANVQGGLRSLPPGSKTPKGARRATGDRRS